MRVDVNERNDLVCIAEDWKQLTKEEHDFLSDCFWQVIWTGFTEDGYLKFNASESNYNNYRRINTMLFHAKSHGVAVGESVREYLQAIDEKAREEQRQADFEREIELKKTVWKNRKETGCMHCKYSIQVGDGDFTCGYSGDELDFKFTEVYNPDTKAMEIFYEVGKPNNHCKDYFEEIEKDRN